MSQDQKKQSKRRGVRLFMISPLAYRYYDLRIEKYLGEKGFHDYKMRVELALVETFKEWGIADDNAIAEVIAACNRTTVEEVYQEEDRIHHDIRALVNMIAKWVSASVKPLIHRGATSADISDTANAARIRDVMKDVVIPYLLELESVLIDLVLREANTRQIGRTHGQHAVPITFGFGLAKDVSRLGQSIVKLRQYVDELVGKFSGAVGSHNAMKLLVDDPIAFEAAVLAKMGLKPAEITSQITPPEPMMRLAFEIRIIAGILADISDTMRHLQRTEIAETGEPYGDDQVGSSTMPKKRNPINFENIKSLWKILVGSMVTVMLDQLSEHQRDLTGSASGRTFGEAIGYLGSMVVRMTRIMRKLEIDHASMERNLNMQRGLISSEPMYILLAALGHPNAHEYTRRLSMKALANNQTLYELMIADPDMKDYIVEMTVEQIAILENPTENYVGLAPQKATQVALHWKQELGL